jgi:hypothetical protein
MDLNLTLEYDDDRYDGVIVKDQHLPETKEEFSVILKYSLKAWKSIGKKGIWLKIPSKKLELSAVAVEYGFAIHHAEIEVRFRVRIRFRVRVLEQLVYYDINIS